MSESTRPQGSMQTWETQKTHIPLQCSVLSMGLQLLIPGHQKVPSFLTLATAQSLFEAIRASILLWN